MTWLHKDSLKLFVQSDYKSNTVVKLNPGSLIDPDKKPCMQMAFVSSWHSPDRAASLDGVGIVHTDLRDGTTLCPTAALEARTAR